MDIRNCRLCQNLFQYPGFGEIICSSCRKKELTEISDIKNYLYTNPSANVTILSKELEIPTKRIFYYIEIGAIQLKDNDKKNYCKRCFKLIPFGSEYCDKCKNELINGFSVKNDKTEKETPQKNEKMRYLK